MKFPPLWITLRGKREGGTNTFITSFVSLFSVFLPSSSVASRVIRFRIEKVRGIEIF